MTPTWLALFFLVAGVVARHKLVTTTEINDSDVSSEDPLMTELSPTTFGYARKFNNELFDDYDDPDEDDDQFYEDDESEGDEQSDTSEDAFKRVDGHFWHRQSTFRVRPHTRNEDPVELEAAKRHHSKAASETKCRLPQPRVVRVLEHHPSASKQYIPSCTVIHQCSEYTGCCASSKRCGPKKIEKLELAFYAVQDSPGLGGHHTRKTYKVEKLIFFNHTECECLVRSDDMPRDVLPTPDPPVENHPFSKCQCPSPFNLRILPGGTCSCDCFDRERDCIKYKKGKDYLNHKDRLCIEMRKCLVPTCDYGNYVRRSGRCPRIGEKHRF